jgi:hypothetical protein
VISFDLFCIQKLPLPLLVFCFEGCKDSWREKEEKERFCIFWKPKLLLLLLLVLFCEGCEESVREGGGERRRRRSKCFDLLCIKKLLLFLVGVFW